MVSDEEVWKVAQQASRWLGGKYRGQPWVDEIEQAAIVGVVKARRSYKPERGASFRTYAFTGARLAAQREHAKWYANDRGLSLHSVANTSARAPAAVRLDRPTAAEGDSVPLRDWLLRNERTPEDDLVTAEAVDLARDAVVRHVQRHPNRRRTVELVTAAWGRGDERIPSKEIGEILGVSRQRVHQLATELAADVREAVAR